MTATLQLEEPVKEQVQHDVPKFLVAWTSPWEEFVTSVRPALARSDALAGRKRIIARKPFGSLAAVL